MPVRTRSEGSEEDEDDGGENEGVVSAPSIGEVSKDELAYNSSGESDGTDILGSCGVLVHGAILSGKNSVDGTNDLRDCL